MAWDRIFPEHQYPTGRNVSGAYTVPVGITQITLRASRVSWPDTGAEVIRASFDLSMDGGATWISPYCGFGAMGGDHYDRNDVLMPYSWVQIRLPQPDNPNRRIRGGMNVISSLRTGIEVEMI